MVAGARRARPWAIVAVVLAATLVACIAVPTGRRYRRVTPLQHAVDHEKALTTVVAVLTENGYTPGVISEGVRTVSTDWRQTDGLLSVLTGFRTRDRVTVTITDSALTAAGESQMRNGPSLFGDKDEHDSGWMGSNPSDELKSQWDSMREIMSERISRMPASTAHARIATSGPDETIAPIAAVSRTNDPVLVPHKESGVKRLRVAVAEFRSIGVDKQPAQILVDRFRSELVGTDRFQVVERERMEAILEEQGFQQGELCGTDECAVEMGRLVGVTAIVAGTIGKLGATYTVTARLISVETGEIVSRASDDCSCEIDGLLAGMHRLAVLLANRVER